jgi:hypothetical protein
VDNWAASVRFAAQVPFKGELIYWSRFLNGVLTVIRVAEISPVKVAATFPLASYATSLNDGKRVFYTTATPDGTTQLWLAPVDRSSSATKVSISSTMPG